MDRQPGIQKAFSVRKLLEAGTPASPLEERVRLSCHPGRCGDVVLVLQPHYLFAKEPLETGTSHGTPWPYDTHVPLLVYGPGTIPGPRSELITPLAAAPILALFLGVAPPANAQVPSGLLADRP
jgi:hypothetical protein